MWVKICANTSVADALAAADAGADAVGFVFAPSPRQVTAEQVRAIDAELPALVERVGVFLPTSVEEIVAAATHARLDAVQLHGGLDPAFSERLVTALNGEVDLIRTIAWEIGTEGQQESVHAELAEVERAGLGLRVLVDAKVAGRSGGLGVAFDWSQARAAFQSQPKLEIILAGGLRAENVAEAIGTLRPWGVDVASGVEAEPGRKDHARVRSFIQSARAAARAARAGTES